MAEIGDLRIGDAGAAGCERLLRAAHSGGWKPQVVLASSSEVYGHNDEDILREDQDLSVSTRAGTRWGYSVSKIADEALGTELVCIDPAPRAPLRGLPVRWIEDVVQRAPDDCFARLRSGDVLFVDSSHVLMPGTDVDWLLNRVLPGLAAGVLVHFHDVFLPDSYPEPWAWRGYNEQQVVAPLLTAGGFKPVFASHYAATRMAEKVAATPNRPMTMAIPSSR